jgi:hypothetical protein
MTGSAKGSAGKNAGTVIAAKNAVTAIAAKNAETATAAGMAIEIGIGIGIVNGVAIANAGTAFK